MKKIAKRKTILLITFGILFTLAIPISNNLKYNKGTSDKITDNDILKLSKISGLIHIDNNWSYTEGNYSWCTGSGTYSDSYVIEDLVINCGGLGCGILIQNSDVFFKIENCTVYNSGTYYSNYGGIKLDKASNGIIIENNCSNNNENGILLTNHAKNNTISNNTINHNKYGIDIRNSANNTILGNTVNHNHDGISVEWKCDYSKISGNNVSYNWMGITIEQSSYINVSGNIANYNYVHGIKIEVCEKSSISGNLANHNDEHGIHLEYDNNNNTISDNNANYNNKHGIYLEDGPNNNTISNNNANYNNEHGIYLYVNANNNTISNNTANYNVKHGMFIHHSHNNTISNNHLSYNTRGISLDSCYNNTILGNIMDECGLVITNPFEEELCSYNIDTLNLVNGKSLYYYTNEINLRPSNFTNAGQVILVNCKDSIISNLEVSYGSVGISLYYCHNNTISGNTANYNKEHGIFLFCSDYNLISGNNLIGNHKCWEEIDSENNIFENNDCGHFQPAIPGYNLIFLLGILSVLVSILISKNRNILKQ